MAQTTIEETFGSGTSARTPERARLSRERYTSAAMMEQEWDGIWTRSWLFAGLVSDLPDAGDYVVFSVGRESIVILHGDDGQLRAFYNVCQHRGNRLFSNESGSVAQVACPYHGWRYSLAGELEEVPDAQRFCPPVDASERSLKPVQLTLWAGLLWINMDPGAQPLQEFLGTIGPTLAPYHFERMVLAQHQTVSVAANWKTVRDNFLEQYHVDYIHPQHASLVDCCNSENVLWPNGHSATRVAGYTTDSRYPVPQETPPHLVPLLEGLGMDPAQFSGRVEDIRGEVQARKRALAPTLGFDCDDLNDEQLSDVWQFDLFPNTFMTIQAEELWIFGPRPHPTDPGRCYLDKWTLQVPREQLCDEARGLNLNPRVEVNSASERPAHSSFDQQAVIDGQETLTITIDQDIFYLPDMQAGMNSRGFDCAVLNQDEVRVQHFHDWVDAWIAKSGEG